MSDMEKIKSLLDDARIDHHSGGVGVDQSVIVYIASGDIEYEVTFYCDPTGKLMDILTTCNCEDQD